ncbi:hypothetical protein LV89_01851 [Arcicella aurantiaca]|uniref:Uncharacterized protein n=1 Tax=Arcicella aurantiaca TaxID=591202 RepID=A0A316EEE7_9BACT|nr:hypothetical protein [Arcicella aurantiaca]PWK27039.1 hypothetical protein LV89_01851 [Arcicella aurantiaca]
MNIFSIFKISEIYNKYNNKTHYYNNGRVFIELRNSQITSITTNDGIPARPDEIQLILNYAINDITRQVKAEFGF